MFRRILFLLVLLGLGFIVWRMINPTGANNALENLQDLPGKIFSRDKTPDNEIVKEDIVEDDTDINIESDTVLVIDDVIIGDKNDSDDEEIIILNSGDDSATLFDEDSALEDALSDLAEEDDVNSEEEIVVEEDKDVNIEESVEENTEEDVIVVEEDKEDEEIIDCRKEGEIALMTSEETKCCEGLNWIYYRGDSKSAGAICFDAEEGIPQCKNQNTKDEGRYYMDGTLLRKDLDCGEYFGTKYYEIETVDDSSNLKSILQNIFK